MPLEVAREIHLRSRSGNIVFSSHWTDSEIPRILCALVDGQYLVNNFALSLVRQYRGEAESRLGRPRSARALSRSQLDWGAHIIHQWREANPGLVMPGIEQEEPTPDQVDTDRTPQDDQPSIAITPRERLRDGGLVSRRPIFNGIPNSLPLPPETINTRSILARDSLSIPLNSVTDRKRGGDEDTSGLSSQAEINLPAGWSRVLSSVGFPLHERHQGFDPGALAWPGRALYEDQGSGVTVFGLLNEAFHRVVEQANPVLRLREPDSGGSDPRSYAQVQFRPREVTPIARFRAGLVVKLRRITVANINADGTIDVSSRCPFWVTDALVRLSTMPRSLNDTAREFGRNTAHCCFCGAGLSDPESVQAGYGPTCAQHWGLPHGRNSGNRHEPTGILNRGPFHTEAARAMDSLADEVRRAASSVNDFADATARAFDSSRLEALQEGRWDTSGSDREAMRRAYQRQERELERQAEQVVQRQTYGRRSGQRRDTARGDATNLECACCGDPILETQDAGIHVDEVEPDEIGVLQDARGFRICPDCREEHTPLRV